MILGMDADEDDQKLRIWDLSREQTRSNVVTQQSSVKALYQKAVKDWNLYSKGRGEEYARPHRPPYIDVTSTENTQMIYGGFAFAGGGGSSGMYNEIRVVNLEVEDLMNSYNHLDIALPGYSVDVGGMKQRSSRSGRSQRGELKSVVSFAGLEMDGGCVLFELSDGSVVHYEGKEGGMPLLKQWHGWEEEVEFKCVTD